MNEGLVLELGCGTGSMTQRLAASGYDMIGVDLSDDMLEIAQEKRYSRDWRSCIFSRICVGSNCMGLSVQW